MFKNLRAEMARESLGAEDIAVAIGISKKSLSNKMCGKTEFTRAEMLNIRKKFFPTLDAGYLFDLDSETKNIA